MSQWYTIHCAACQGHDFIGRPCRGRQIPLQPADGFWFTVDSLAAISRAVPMSMDDYWLEESGIVRFDHDAYATAIIKAAKEAERE